MKMKAMQSLSGMVLHLFHNGEREYGDGFMRLTVPKEAVANLAITSLSCLPDEALKSDELREACQTVLSLMDSQKPAPTFRAISTDGIIDPAFTDEDYVVLTRWKRLNPGVKGDVEDLPFWLAVTWLAPLSNPNRVLEVLEHLGEDPEYRRTAIPHSSLWNNTRAMLPFLARFRAIPESGHDSNLFLTEQGKEYRRWLREYIKENR